MFAQNHWKHLDAWDASKIKRYPVGKWETRPMLVDWNGDGKLVWVQLEFGSTKVETKEYGSELGVSWQGEPHLYVEHSREVEFFKDPKAFQKRHQQKTPSPEATSGSTDLKFNADQKTEPEKLPITFKRFEIGPHDPFKIASDFNPYHYGVSFATGFGDVNGDGRIDLLFVPEGKISEWHLFDLETRAKGNYTEKQNAILDDAKAVEPHLYVMLNKTPTGPPKFGKPQKIIASGSVNSIQVIDLDGDGNPEIVLGSSAKKNESTVRILSTKDKTKYSNAGG